MTGTGANSGDPYRLRLCGLLSSWLAPREAVLGLLALRRRVPNVI
jgi:hypothetical protein